MRSTLNIDDINNAREKGRTKILSLVSEWPDTLGPDARVEKLKQLFDARVQPIRMAIENFEPDKFHRRRLSAVAQKQLILTSFQAVEEATAISDSIEQVANAPTARTVGEDVRRQADQYNWELCQAFYTYVTRGRVTKESPSNIIGLEIHMANRGEFPIDILQNLMLPPCPEGA